MDPLRRLQPGDSVAGHLRSAQRHNLLSDAARIVLGNQRSQTAPPPIPGGMSGLVLAKNLTDTAIDRFGVLRIGSVFPDPGDNLVAFQQGRVIRVSAPTGKSNEPVLIAQQPIAAGAVGLAVVHGVTVVQVNATDTTATAWTQAAGIEDETGYLTAMPFGPATILWRESGTGTKWALVSIGAPGGVTSLWVTLSGALAQGSTATATGTYRGVSISITVRDKLIPVGGDSVASGSLVRVAWNHDDDAWDAVNSACA